VVYTGKVSLAKTFGTEVMALLALTALSDMTQIELIQFMSSCIIWPRQIITEAVTFSLAFC
jgi:hypothetical protein